MVSLSARERQLAAIRHESSDRISIDAIAVENTAALAGFLGIEIEEVIERLGLDGRIVQANYGKELPLSADGVSTTEWGTPGVAVPYGKAREYPLANTEDILEIERYAWPDPADYLFEDAAELAHDVAGNYAVRGPYWKPLFCRVCDLFGMEEAMIRLLASPVLFEAALQKVFEFTEEYCSRLLDACGDDMPILCLGDDFASQRGLMISPGSWRKFLKPKYANLFQLGKKRGKFVWFHSCGDITEVLPDLIDIGMDVWETVQLHTLPIMPEQLKREYGSYITFFGGINTQRLPFCTPQDVEREVKSTIRILGENGGYICGPDHHIKPDVPPENTVALFDTAASFHYDAP